MLIRCGRMLLELRMYGSIRPSPCPLLTSTFILHSRHARHGPRGLPRDGEPAHGQDPGGRARGGREGRARPPAGGCVVGCLLVCVCGHCFALSFSFLRSIRYHISYTAPYGLTDHPPGLYTKTRGPHTFWLSRGEVGQPEDGVINLLHYEDAARCVNQMSKRWVICRGGP